MLKNSNLLLKNITNKFNNLKKTPGLLKKTHKRIRKKNSIKILSPLYKEVFLSDLSKTNHNYYYCTADGIFQSYWIGKFINFFNKKGKKKAISNIIYKAFFHLKYTHFKAPALFILDLLEKIKPTFKLLNVYHRGSFVKYPKFVQKKKQYLVAVKWLYWEIWSTEEKALINILYEKFLSLQRSEWSNLLEQRDKNIKQSVIAQDNIRLIKKFKKKAILDKINDFN